jgi:hypothetical protein
MNESGHLTNIQMPEFPLLRVIINRTQPLAFRAWEFKIFRMFDVYIYPFFLLVQIYLRNKPGPGDSENLGKKSGILHITPRNLMVLMGFEKGDAPGDSPPRYLRVSPAVSRRIPLKSLYIPVQRKKQSAGYYILWSPTQMCDAAKNI